MCARERTPAAARTSRVELIRFKLLYDAFLLLLERVRFWISLDVLELLFMATAIYYLWIYDC